MIVQKTSVFPAPRDVVFHGVIRYSFTQCPNAEFAKRHHMEDVLPVMCNCDHLAMQKLHACLIREAFRFLRPGGEMYINDLTRKGVHLTDALFHWEHAEEPLFTMKEFEQQALKSGFATVKRCNYAGLDFCFKFQKENADCSVLSGNPYQERRTDPCL